MLDVDRKPFHALSIHREGVPTMLCIVSITHQMLLKGCGYTPSFSLPTGLRTSMPLSLNCCSVDTVLNQYNTNTTQRVLGHVPPRHLPQGHIPPGQFPPGHIPRETYPLGHIPPGTYTPWTLTPRTLTS